MSQTVTSLIRHTSQDLIAATLPQNNTPIVVDLEAPGFNSLRRSSWLSGIDLHRSIAGTVKGKGGSDEFSIFASRILSWLAEVGASNMRAEIAVVCADVRGVCDICVTGGYAEHGIVEIKCCDDLPQFSDWRHRLQLNLYAYAASQWNGRSSTWGAIAYCSLRASAIRVFLFTQIRVQADAVDLAIRRAA